MKFMRPDRPMPPTVPTTGPVASPAPMPVMPIASPPTPMPVRPNLPTTPVDPMTQQLSLGDLMRRREELQAELDRVNSLIEQMTASTRTNIDLEGIGSLIRSTAPARRQGFDD